MDFLFLHKDRAMYGQRENVAIECNTDDRAENYKINFTSCVSRSHLIIIIIIINDSANRIKENVMFLLVASQLLTTLSDNNIHIE